MTPFGRIGDWTSLKRVWQAVEIDVNKLFKELSGQIGGMLLCISVTVFFIYIIGLSQREKLLITNKISSIVKRK